jgi:diacylglycerol kinase (ATP)
VVPLVPSASIDDGLLDVVLFTGHGPVEAAAHAARVLAGAHTADPAVVMRKVRRLRVEPVEGSLLVQSDGDPRGQTPLDVTVAPGALFALGA